MTESPSPLSSALLGILRGGIVHSLIHPIENLKVNYQANHGTTTLIEIIKKKGVSGLYQGLGAKIFQTSIKQMWVWPLMTHMPAIFPPVYQQIFVGMTIATIDATISTPLERAKMDSMLNGKRSVYQFSWKGFPLYYGKLSVNWSTFLVAENYFRSKDKDQPTSKLDLVARGAKVAFVVALAAAPVDLAHTLYQKGNLKEFAMKKMYIGSPLNFLSLIVHNIASVTLMEYLCNSSKNLKKF